MISESLWRDIEDVNSPGNLEPGGFLQWDEVDTLGSFVESIEPSAKKDALDHARRQLSNPGKSRGLDE